MRERMEETARAHVIGELSAHLQQVESGASPLRPLGHVFRDPETEQRVVGHCRYVLGLVARRRRSTHEIRVKLREREDDPDVLEEVLARLERADILDDHAFAREWVAHRRTVTLLGTAALRSELETKGVQSTTINSVLAEAEQDDAGEKERCTQLVRSRLEKELRCGKTKDRGALMRRLGAAACRRGYSQDLARFVVMRELDAAGLTWS